MKWTSTISPLIKEIELRKQPVIIRVNKFDEDSANKFQLEIAQAHNTGQKVIPVIIDSYGGQVYSLMTMISAIKHAEIPVATIVEGKAMSCGAVLLTFGEEGMRFADPDATIMIHDVSSGGYGKVEELKASSEEAGRLDDKIFTGSGTAFFISDEGHMITNHHVVNYCNITKVNYFGKTGTAKILAYDRVNDLALLETDIKPK